MPCFSREKGTRKLLLERASVYHRRRGFRARGRSPPMTQSTVRARTPAPNAANASDLHAGGGGRAGVARGRRAGREVRVVLVGVGTAVLRTTHGGSVRAGWGGGRTLGAVRGTEA